MHQLNTCNKKVHIMYQLPFLPHIIIQSKQKVHRIHYTSTFTSIEGTELVEHEKNTMNITAVTLYTYT